MELAVAPCVAPMNAVVACEETFVCPAKLVAELAKVSFRILSLFELILAWKADSLSIASE